METRKRYKKAHQSSLEIMAYDYKALKRNGLNTKFCVLLLILLSMVSGCKKFIEIPGSKQQIGAPAVFADSADATSAVLGIYISMIDGSAISTPFNGEITVYTGLSSDELYTTNTSSSDVQFYQNALNSNSNSQLLWNGAYTVIYQANACIEGLTSSTGLGECKLVRAMNYFHLVNLFGAVPLVVTTDYKSSGSLPQTAVASVYAQIIADLSDAEGLMSADYITSGKARPNKYAATALLAKVYLYLQQWANAETKASQVINSGIYSLNGNLNDVFLAGSDEAIWQLQPTDPGYETPEGTTFIPYSSSTAPMYVISNFLLNAFESGDLRKRNWLNSVTVSGMTYYYPFKYKLGNDYNSSPLENYMLSRLGEQYLIRAEARAQQNNPSDAISDLNVIRNRAGLPNVTNNNQTAVLNAIMHERQVELFCELGNRWYDLKRTGTANTVMPAICTVKGGVWSTNWQLYPVPYSELQRNPFLVQNTGY
jgi:hypothetical protein